MRVISKKTLREFYENKDFKDSKSVLEAWHYVIDMPNPIEAIKFKMEQAGLRQKDLASLFGNKVRVSEVLNKKIRLTLNMIRNIHEELHIPFENLLNRYELESI